MMWLKSIYLYGTYICYHLPYTPTRTQSLHVRSCVKEDTLVIEITDPRNSSTELVLSRSRGTRKESITTYSGDPSLWTLALWRLTSTHLPWNRVILSVPARGCPFQSGSGAKVFWSILLESNLNIFTDSKGQARHSQYILVVQINRRWLFQQYNVWLG